MITTKLSVPTETIVPDIQTTLSRMQETEEGSLGSFRDEIASTYQLYLDDIKQYPKLTFGQEKWLGIAIECPKLTIDDPLFQNIKSVEDPFQAVFVILFDLIYSESEILRGYLSKKGFSQTEISKFFISLIWDARVFQEFPSKHRRSVLPKSLDLFPSSIHNYLYDYCVYLYASPPKILQTIQRSLNHTGKLPVKEEIIRSLNDLDDLSSEIKAIHDRARKARNTLILHNLRLVAFIANLYENRGLDITDLCQEGSIGLIKSTDKFEYRQGYRFSTYSVWLIRRSITRALANKSATVRLPVHIYEKMQRIRRARVDLFKELGRKPTIEELAERSDLSVTELMRIFKRIRNKYSLDEIICCEAFPLSIVETEIDTDVELIQTHPCPIREHAQHFSAHLENKHDDEWELPPCSLQRMKGSTISGDKPDYSNLMISLTKLFEPGLNLAHYQKVGDYLRDRLSKLDDQQRTVIEKRFGFEDGEEHTRQEISKELGITRARVRQIEKAGLRRLRRSSILSRLQKLMEQR